MDNEEKKALEETVESWDRWLTSWKKNLYPVFEKHGIDINTALIAYRVNMVGGEIAQLGEPEKEDWEA